MKNKTGRLKITICAAFLAAFAAATLFSSVSKKSAGKILADAAENPQNCAECHQTNFASWHRSSHGKTVRKASVETVRGDFTGANRLENPDIKAEMTGDGENFFVVINNETYRIKAVVGTKRVEQYVGEKNGELHSLPVAYDLAEKRWINLDETVFEKETASFSKHPDNFKNWKTDCAACHRSGANDFSEIFGEIGISCAACHGDAAEHVASKNSVRSKLGFETENKIVNPQHLSSDAAMMSCAECHGRDSPVQPQIQGIGDQQSAKQAVELVSAHQPAEINAERLWADGSYKFSGNEYRSIVRSVCYAQSKAGGHGIAGEKINCASCHSSHESDGEIAANEKTDNQNCIICHLQFSDDAAIAEHTKHPIDSEASRCASCHQPEIVFARSGFTRTHEISVPNPVLTAEKQIPNACNLCHTEQSVNWAITASKNFWSPRFRDAETNGERQYDQPETVRALASKDEFLRASAVDSMRKHSDLNWSKPFLIEAFRAETSPVVKSLIAATLKLNSTESQ